MTESNKRIIIILVSIVMFMEFLDTTIINTAVPSIARSFQQDPLLLKFSVTSYLLSLAIFTPISGWCADKLGTKKVFLFSVSLFVLASFFCGVSKNILELTSFRFLQGMGGAFMSPVSRIVIIRIFNPKDLVRVQGYIFTPAMLGFVLGPFAGGLITTYLSWNWIFYINIPTGLATIYYGYFFMPQQQDEKIKKLDLFGFILSGISLGCISFSIDMIGHYDIVSKNIVSLTGFSGVLLFIILVFYCIKKLNPILDFLLLRMKIFRISLFSNMTMYMVSSSIAFLLPLMYQEQFLYSPAYSGTLVLPIAFGQLIFRPIAPRVINKCGFKKAMIISCLFVILSLFFVAQIHLNTPIYYIIFSEFLFGGAIIIYLSSTGALNYVDVPKNLTSRATALDLTSRQFSASLGVGISALFLNFFRHKFSLEFSSSHAIKIFHYTLYIIALFALISLFQILQLKKDDGNHALKR